MRFIDNLFGRKKVGIALSAGGARGIAHLGVLKAANELGFDIRWVSGSSMGAVIGAMYAFQPDPFAVAEHFVNVLRASDDKIERLSIFSAQKDLRRKFFQNAREMVIRFMLFTTLSRKTYILERELLEDIISQMLPEANIEDAKMPLAIVAYDLDNAEQFVITRGPVRKAVLASSSIPCIFEPAEWIDKRLLVDGGGISAVPVEAVMKIGARRVIAVDVSETTIPDNDLKNSIDIIIRLERGESKKLKQIELQKAWKTISIPLDGVKWYDFEYYDNIIKRGYEAAMLALKVE